MLLKKLVIQIDISINSWPQRPAIKLLTRKLPVPRAISKTVTEYGPPQIHGKKSIIIDHPNWVALPRS